MLLKYTHRFPSDTTYLTAQFPVLILAILNSVLKTSPDFL